MSTVVNSEPSNSQPGDWNNKRRIADEKLSRAMVNSITDYAVILTDPKGLIISLNKGAKLILGYTESEVIGKSIAIFYPEETSASDDPAMNLQEALINNNYQIKGWRLKKNGTRFLANIHYTALYDDEHQLLGYTKIIYELSEEELNADNSEKVKTAIGGNLSFRKLIENSYSGITLLDRNFNIIYRSRSAERIGGWSMADRIKSSMDEMIHPDDRNSVNELLNDTLLSPGIPKRCVFRSRHFDGHYIWLDCVYTNYLSEPNVNAIVCNFIDVTEERKSKEELKSSERRFKSLLENGSDGISVLSIDRKPLYVSPGLCHILGYTESDTALFTDIGIIHPDDFESARLKFIECFNNPGVPIKNVVYRVRHKNGQWVYLDATLTNFLQDPDIAGIVNNFRDITDAKVKEDKVIESERFIKTITNNVPALIAYWTADLHCLFANKPYSDWFEKEPSEMIGISKKQLLGEEEFKQHEIHINGVLNGEPQSFERSFKKPTGEQIFTQTQYVPNSVGNVVKGFYSLIYDITELKLAEREISKKTEQIEELLENINDGFIALDENMCYTYANKQITTLTGVPAESLIGRNIWEVFPDAIGSNIYKAIHTALNEKVYVANEDHFPKVNLWQENRVYPTESGVSVFIRDITKGKQEEHHLKLLESVITNTSDAVMITEAEPQDELGLRILYINDAFTEMTGYNFEDVVGKSPRILQGPKSDSAELKRLHDAMLNWQPCEISTINYKKNGEEFWLNLSITPVTNEQGWFTHWIAIERNITAQKIEEQQNALLAAVSNVFNEQLPLNEILFNALQKLADYGDFSMAEAWLISTDKKKANLFVKYPSSAKMGEFYKESSSTKSFVKGEGLPGLVWETATIQYLTNIEENEYFLRKKAAKKVGLKNAYGVPLHFKNEIIGILILGSNREETKQDSYSELFEKFGRNFGAEIRRKQLEEELNQIFNFAPDIICIVGVDGYFKKVNPAMIHLLGRSEPKLLNTPFIEFVYPEDQATAVTKFNETKNGQPALYFENRYVTNSGKIKWLAWTTSPASEEGLIFSVAKDVTEKKELEDLLSKATSLAHIGAWEVDLKKGVVYWSDMTREIHETEPNYSPDLEAATNFYLEGESRETITRCMSNAAKNGISSDVELQIVTTKGNVKWVRVIVEAELLAGKCIKLYGSFQDIDARKKAEMSAKEVLSERNTILESIGDAFFAVDKNWVVTYWNKVAEKVLGKRKEEMLDNNLWNVFTDSVGSESYKNYHLAIKRKSAMHFEDYYPPLEKWYEISAYPSESGLSVYFKDVTDRKKSDQYLIELNTSLQLQAKELAISNAELEQFAYVASHDLQEPLRMVTSFLTQIERKYSEKLDEKGKQYINFAVDGAKRMRQIILDLLEFSRVGTSEENIEDIRTGTLINEVLALYRKQIEEKKATVLFENAPVIRGYKTPLRQVFQNLISNGLKYQEPGAIPVIRISFKETKRHWQIAVNDNGIGIEPEYFEKIFIIFQRLHNKDEYAGTGMGLAITKKIVESLGGTIWVESVLGKGSTFYFTILKN